MFFEREEGGEIALLVHTEVYMRQDGEDLPEFIELAKSAGLQIADVLEAKLKAVHPKSYLGKGKLEELASLVQALEVEVVLFNNTLSPSQERNLESSLKCKVIDRTGLILDIFAQRARTHEGKLQVELAQLQHMSTRLVRGWTHLERQKGGIGLRGPGETQLETDRRLLRERIKSIQKKLEKVQKQRDQGRKGRQRAELPTLSIVGYTNAGKSTLFNRLSGAKVYAADQLFATLDPTLRRVEIPQLGPVILADTVGFIKHLPHKLVDAFKATLEETILADLLIHVVDAASPERDDNMVQVDQVLKEIGADGQRQLLVYNKVDLLQGVEPHIDFDESGQIEKVWLSAGNGDGIALLEQAVATLLAKSHWFGTICLPPSAGQIRAELFSMKVVEEESYDEQGNVCLDVTIDQADIHRLEKKLGFSWDQYVVS